jgi:hypothetical protein
MPKNAAQNTAISNLGTAGDTLADRIAAFTAAEQAASTANSNLASTTAALDAAWTDFKAKDTTFDSLMLVAPAGYTPPA